MGEALGLTIGGPGRRAQAVAAHYVRDLREEDFAQAELAASIKARPLQALRQTHHTLARLLAQGKKQEEIAAVLGMSPSRISILKADPQFQELLSYYADMEADGYEVARADMKERLAGLGFDAIEILHEKLEQEPEAFSTKELLAIVEASADRTGHGKTQKVEASYVHSISEETLERVRGATNQGALLAAEDRRALMGGALRATAEHSSAEKVEGRSGEGTGIRAEVHQEIDGEFSVVAVPPVGEVPGR